MISTGTRKSATCPEKLCQPSTALSATAPPGGCRQRASDIINMAVATANAAAKAGSPIACATTTPKMPEMKLPPTIDQGWASGLAGTANSSTADAPIGAMIHGIVTGNIAAQIRPARLIPTSAPTLATTRSRRLAPASSGKKIRLESGFATDISLKAARWRIGRGGAREV